MTRSVHLILGAHGAVGSDPARRLAARGDALVLLGRDGAKLAALAAETGALPVTGDATVAADVERAVQAALSAHGRLDGAVNCVGSVLLKPAHMTRDEEFLATLATNLHSSFWLVRAAAKAMEPSGGAIVLVSTAAAAIGLANHEAIAAAKAGVEGLARSAAASYAARRIRVNCVAPGLVRSALTARITGSESVLKASLAMHPLGRVGEPADVARALEFLLDPANDWITGQVLGVDGGLGMLKTRGNA
ncbi:MAG: SDR family oxidoreductase [Planctomycetes bacterium]|nr:SDR family oxidoreductase [Planctomycetota bacterium]